MQIMGMLHGSQPLKFAGYPMSEILGPDASEDQIKALISRQGSVFIKPVFKGGVGKKGKAGLVGRATDLHTALKEKERLYFVEHRVGNIVAKANGVTFEGTVPAEQEVYFSITDSTPFRAPTMTLTHHGGWTLKSWIGRARREARQRRHRGQRFATVSERPSGDIACLIVWVPAEQNNFAHMPESNFLQRLWQVHSRIALSTRVLHRLLIAVLFSASPCWI